MTKKHRMSFRITQIQESRVNYLMTKDSSFRDKSEIGTRSIKHYLRLLENNPLAIELIIDAVLLFCEKYEVDRKEVAELREIIENYRDRIKAFL